MAQPRGFIFKATHMPHGYWAIFALQVFATLSYAILYVTLTLYMTTKLGMDAHQADIITGVFLAANYTLHMLAGAIGGKWLSYRTILLISIPMQIMGSIILSHTTIHSLYVGLALLLTGTGTMSTCINMLLSQLFAAQDERREMGFLLNYSGMNIGFFVGFLVAGYYQSHHAYHTLFTLSAVGSSIALAILLRHWDQWHDKNTTLSLCHDEAQHKRHLAGWATMMLLIPLLYLFLHHPAIGDNTILGIGMAAILLFLRIALKHKGPEKRSMLGFLILILAAQSFWMVYQLIPMALTLFIQHNVDRQLFGFHFPTGWVQNLNATSIILCAPLLAWLFKTLRSRRFKVTVPVQFACGVTLVGIGLLILPMGIHHANAAGLSPFGFIAATYVVQAIAELCINPVSYAMVGRYVPSTWQSLGMGMVLLNAGVAAVLASHISNMAVGHSTDPLLSNASYSHTFQTMGLATLGVALTLMLLLPVLHRLLKH